MFHTRQSPWIRTLVVAAALFVLACPAGVFGQSQPPPLKKATVGTITVEVGELIPDRKNTRVEKIQEIETGKKYRIYVRILDNRGRHISTEIYCLDQDGLRPWTFD